MNEMPTSRQEKEALANAKVRVLPARRHDPCYIPGCAGYMHISTVRERMVEQNGELVYEGYTMHVTLVCSDCGWGCEHS